MKPVCLNPNLSLAACRLSRLKCKHCTKRSLNRTEAQVAYDVQREVSCTHLVTHPGCTLDQCTDATQLHSCVKWSSTLWQTLNTMIPFTQYFHLS